MTKRKKQHKTVRVNHFIEFGEVTVENPMFSYDHPEGPGNVRNIPAITNVRESPLAFMYCNKDRHGNRGIDEAQLAAGSYFRELYETTAGATIQAIDTTKEPVDGGKISDGLTDKRFRAAKELEAARLKLGDTGYRLVEQVCGECKWLNQIEPTKHYQRLASDRLKDCLETLAIFWGMASVNTHRRAS